MYRRVPVLAYRNATQPNPESTSRWAHTFSQRVGRLARITGPTLIALTFAGVAHAQGTMDFSGAQTLMTTFKTFAIYAGACHLFRRTHFCGNPHDEWAFPGCHTRTLWCPFWCRSARLGSRMDRVLDRTDDVGGASSWPSGENRYRSIKR